MYSCAYWIATATVVLLPCFQILPTTAGILRDYFDHRTLLA